MAYRLEFVSLDRTFDYFAATNFSAVPFMQ